MPIALRIADGLVAFTLSGQTTPRRVPAALEAALSDPTQSLAVGLLLHDTGSTYNPTYDEVVDLARLLGRLGDRFGRRAAFVAVMPVHYGIGRMLGVFAECLGIDFRVFRDLAVAEAWLIGPQEGQ